LAKEADAQWTHYRQPAVIAAIHGAIELPVVTKESTVTVGSNNCFKGCGGEAADRAGTLVVASAATRRPRLPGRSAWRQASL
jgi:hypothetical protein